MIKDKLTSCGENDGCFPDRQSLMRQTRASSVDDDITATLTVATGVDAQGGPGMMGERVTGVDAKG